MDKIDPREEERVEDLDKLIKEVAAYFRIEGAMEREILLQGWLHGPIQHHIAKNSWYYYD